MEQRRRAWCRVGAAVLLGAAVWGGAELDAGAQGKGERTPSAADVEEARRLNLEVFALLNAGKYDVAMPLAQRALAMREKALGVWHPAVAISLNNLASLHQWKGEYHRAEPLYLRAVDIQERALGPDAPDVASSLNNLAALYWAKGEYGRAEPLFQRALVIRENAFGPDHPYVAVSLNNVAALYDARGEHDRAEPLCRRALAIFEKALGPRDPAVATTLNNIAALHDSRGEHDRAEPLYLRALAIFEEALGRDHPEVANSLNNLVTLYAKRGEYGRAEPLGQRALAIWERTVGPDHPRVADALNNLAALYDSREAEPLFGRALAIQEKALGEGHPKVATSLNNLSSLYWASDRIPEVIVAMARAQDVREKTLGRLVATGSEAQKLTFLRPFLREPDAVTTLALRTRDVRAGRLALLTLFRRKGRALDAMAGSMRTLRARLGPEEQKLFDALQAARSRHVTISLRGPGATPLDVYRHVLDTLNEQIRQLEEAISQRSEPFKAEEQPVTVAAVQAALPDDAALVEWSVYQPFNPKARTERESWGASRYAASVLSKQGDPTWVDLGDATAIDADIQALRDAFARPANKDVSKLVRALEAKVMAPVRAQLGGTRRVFLSPDGALNLVPFAALLGEDGHPLIERYAFAYLTSGRDLLRRTTHTSPREAPLVVTSPDFGAGSTPFTPLHHGTEVGNTIASRFQHPAPIVLTGSSVTKDRLQQIHGPQFLHLDSHGYFDAAVCSTEPPDALRDNPLLRSGIALSGANACTKGNHDGLLTASEASGLDLYGTRLVVLSACETGVGQAEAGDGVYGLRRALVLAGAETQVMSLWSVDEAATAALMMAYYEALAQGGGRSEAMRQVQLAMLHDGRHEHPYYWASFIVSGDDRSLDGRAVEPDLRVHPGGACACRAGGAAPEGEPLWLVGAAALVLAGRGARRHRVWARA